MAPILILVLALLALAVVALPNALKPGARIWVYGGCTAITATLVLLAIHRLIAGGEAAVVLPLGIPWLGAHLRIDALAAFFLLVVNLGAAAASLFALGHGRHEPAPARVLPFYPAFLAGLDLVVLADDAFTFLLSWEFMSLASWALVVAHHREAANARAGYVYVLMASFGTLALLLAFGLLAGPNGHYAFASMRAAEHGSTTQLLVLVLAISGAGSKAGLVPLHVWLPLAHPAAPSHVSALMSGVMTKVAIYGLVRILFDLMGEPVWWWGAVLLVLGAISALVGVLHALMQHDLKRLLAYHTVENIGIITIGLGLALAFSANGQAAFAALAMSAALLHVLNHMLFKSLLFFGAGAVHAATHERDMEHLGGLVHRMPVTAATFLIGSAAISALPPLNGFVSEWLTFQAILASPDLPQWPMRFLVPAVGVTLALSAALAAACFVKAFGISFLGRARSQAAAHATETGSEEKGAMMALAGLCVLAGVLPGMFVDLLAPAVLELTGAGLASAGPAGWLRLVPLEPERAGYSGLVLATVAGGMALAVVWAIRRFASRGLRVAPVWDCGAPGADPATQYTATSFAQPIRRVFGPAVFAAREAVAMPAPGDMRPARLRVVMRDLIWERFYLPLAALTGAIADRLNPLQFLSIRRYLALVLTSLALLMMVITLWR